MTRNAAAGADLIDFNIGTATFTIIPATNLPPITDPVTIDGATQSGFAGVPLIEISGTNITGAGTNGLRIGAGSSTIRSLVIRSFTGHGLELATNGNNLIKGCYLGTGLSGTNDLGNTLSGIFITNSRNNFIGGTSSTNRNVIFSNNQQGVHIGGTNSFGNQILGNIIGLGATGSNALANSQNGVLVSNARSNLIGGAIAGAWANQILDNYIGLGSAFARMRGNLIGTDDTDTNALGNSGHGVEFVTNARTTLSAASARARQTPSPSTRVMASSWFPGRTTRFAATPFS